MKRIVYAIGIVSLLISFSLNSIAQETQEHHPHKFGFPKMDTARMHDFSCTFENFDVSDFPFCKNKNKYNGHWAGIELGIGAYVTPDFDMNFNPAYPYMSMNTARSLMVNFNPFELNLNLYRNHIGFTTGLGFQTLNYYFTENYVMLQDSSALVAYRVQDPQGNFVSLKTNKMVVSYLTLPLFFEYQTNRSRKINSFHVTAGVIAGVRIGSYTKQAYSNEGGTYYLVDDKGTRVATYDINKHTATSRGAYHLSPFKVDAAFRIGWSHLNLFGTYSLTQLFQKNQGPEVYPFTVGITLLGW